MIDMNTAVALAVAASVIGLIFAIYQRNFVLAQDEGSARMRQIAAAIQKGAQAFLTREYRAVAILVLIVTVALVILSQVPDSGMSILTAVAFVCGALASGLSGYIGMYIAVRANVRTAQAASQSLNRGSARRLRQRHSDEHDGGLAGAAGHQPALHLSSSISLAMRRRRRRRWRASASAAPRSPFSPALAAASIPRRPMSARTWSARPKPASPKMIRAIPPPLPIMLATTSAMSPAWARTSSRVTPVRSSRRSHWRPSAAPSPATVCSLRRSFPFWSPPPA